LRIVVNRLLCEGNGVCAQKAPEIIAMDDDDEVVILKESFGEELREQATAAVRGCPKHALTLED
jgi:ferredoxin